MTDSTEHSKDKKDRSTDPVWHRPAWITAIVAVISTFLTIPDKVGDYLAQEQMIEIEKQKVKAAEINNDHLKQKQEFSIIQNLLLHTGDERVAMLRYFAATLDDDDAKKWAKSEVERLDDLASLESEQQTKRSVLALLEQQFEHGEVEGEGGIEISQEIARLREELLAKDSQISEIRQKAGIEKEPKTAAFGELSVNFELLPKASDPGNQSQPIFLRLDNNEEFQCTQWGGTSCNIPLVVMPSEFRVFGPLSSVKASGKLRLGFTPNGEPLWRDFGYDCEFDAKESGRLPQDTKVYACKKKSEVNRYIGAK